MSMIINPYLFTTSGSGGGSIPTLAKIIHLESDVAGIVLNGGNVREWPDQSGLNNKAFQYVTSYQPQYLSSSSEMNGLPAIAFDSPVDEAMFISSVSSLNISTNGFTLYMVLDVDIYPSTISTFIQHSNDVVWTQGWGIIYINNKIRFWINNWNNVINYVELNAPTINQRVMIKFTWDKTTMTGIYRQNGVTQEVMKMYAGAYTNPAYPIGIMSPTGGSSIYESQGKLGAILMYSQLLSTTDQTNIETYLKTKYGIA